MKDTSSEVCSDDYDENDTMKSFIYNSDSGSETCSISGYSTDEYPSDDDDDDDDWIWESTFK